MLTRQYFFRKSRQSSKSKSQNFFPLRILNVLRINWTSLKIVQPTRQKMTSCKGSKSLLLTLRSILISPILIFPQKKVLSSLKCPDRGHFFGMLVPFVPFTSEVQLIRLGQGHFSLKIEVKLLKCGVTCAQTCSFLCEASDGDWEIVESFARNIQ